MHVIAMTQRRSYDLPRSYETSYSCELNFDLHKLLQTPFPKYNINNLLSKMQLVCRCHRFMTKFMTAVHLALVCHVS